MKTIFSKRNTAIMIACAIVITVVSITGIGSANATNGNQSNDLLTAYSDIEKTTEGIQAYVVAAHALSATISNTELSGVMTTITFSERLSAEEVFDFAAENNLEIAQIQGRGYDASGTWISLAARADIGLDRMKDSVSEQAEVNEFTFAGYTGINARVNANKLTDIQNSPKVFLADVSGDRYFQGYTQADGTARNYEDGKRATDYPQSLAWPIEELGLLSETAN
ncbi:hypothetical protein FACS18949_16350 [Clostridia bacterium]|nr:hypothetical protein FACS18949_16350 [Clostridia bacterium]